MKKSVLFVLFVLVVCMFCLVSCSNKTADIDEVIETYCDFMEKEDMQEWHFALAYIDEDDIPELVVAGDIPNAFTDSIYTYADGTVTNLGDVGTHGGFKFAPRQNSVMWSKGSPGLFYAEFLSIKGGKLEKIKCFTDNSEDIGNTTTSYVIDNEEVPKEEYYAEFEKMTNEHTYVSIGYYNEFTIKDCLEELEENWQNFLIEE